MKSLRAFPGPNRIGIDVRTGLEDPARRARRRDGSHLESRGEEVAAGEALTTLTAAD